MPEPFELIDEDELLIFLAMLEYLENQSAQLMANPELVLSDAFWADEAAAGTAALVPVVEEFMYNGAINALGELPADPNAFFGHVQTAAQNHVGNLIKGINETTQSQVVDLLDKSIAENWSLDELTEALMDFPGSPFGQQRARMIAVTETTNAYMHGAEVLGEQLINEGYEVEYIWLTANDDRVCEICAPRHLQPRGTNWEDMGAPHPGCRCDVDVRKKRG